MSVRGNNPLVILAGWLGSQPGHLKRYELLYRHGRHLRHPNSNSFNVHTRIATPAMVVGAVLNGPATNITVPSSWPGSLIKGRSNAMVTMQDLAWDLLAEIHHRQPPFVLFHVFSNGGCFLWEQVCRILDLLDEGLDDASALSGLETPQQERQVATALRGIRERIRGVVFDSCPGADLYRIGEAMQYCSWRDRWHVWLTFGMDYILLEEDSTQRKLRARGDSYMRYLKTHSWSIPQLYLYSADDPLARVDAVDDLIQCRRKLIGKEIWSRRWESSLHCGHLRTHPEEYQDAVESFVAWCTMRSRL